MWGIVLLMATAIPGLARAQFQQLVKELPRSANAVMLLNIERAKESPLGVREGWKGKLEKAFQDGLIRVPPQAQRVVLAAQFDFETMSPTWESAVMDLSGEISPSAIANTYLGQVDRVEDLDAVVLPKGTYIVKLHPQIVAAVEPASRHQPKDDRGDSGDHQVAGRSRRRDEHPFPPPVQAQIPQIDGHRLGPSDERQARHHRHERKHDGADHVDVHHRIE